jgi:hypothetical protein
MDMLYKPVVAATERGGYVLDGFPRTVEQAEAAYDVAHRLGAEVRAAIHLDVPTDELVRRLLARSRGSEDSQAVIEHRIEVYQQNAAFASGDRGREIDRGRRFSNAPLLVGNRYDPGHEPVVPRGTSKVTR